MSAKVFVAFLSSPDLISLTLPPPVPSVRACVTVSIYRCALKRRQMQRLCNRRRAALLHIVRSPGASYAMQAAKRLQNAAGWLVMPTSRTTNLRSMLRQTDAPFIRRARDAQHLTTSSMPWVTFLFTCKWHFVFLSGTALQFV